jgi:hypothetical protein
LEWQDNLIFRSTAPVDDDDDDDPSFVLILPNNS